MLNDVCINQLPSLTSYALRLCIIPIPKYHYTRILSRNILDKLFFSDINSKHGMSIVSEQPMNNDIMLNISRPAVLRQYYGNNVGYVKNNIVSRTTYGYKSSVGTDPAKYITKPFDTDMHIMSKYVMSIIRKLYTEASTKVLDLTHEFNSCTVLTYFGDKTIKKQSKMAWHCDTKYNSNGHYINKGQVINTPVVIITYGHDHILNWRRVINSNNKWVRDQTFHNIPMILNDEAFMLLHPFDEIPHKSSHSNDYLRYEHGNVQLPHNDGMSVSLVLRVMSTHHFYDDKNNQMMHQTDDTNMSLTKISNEIKKAKLYEKIKEVQKFDNMMKSCYRKIRHEHI